MGESLALSFPALVNRICSFNLRQSRQGSKGSRKQTSSRTIGNLREKLGELSNFSWLCGQTQHVATNVLFNLRLLMAVPSWGSPWGTEKALALWPLFQILSFTLCINYGFYFITQTSQSETCLACLPCPIHFSPQEPQLGRALACIPSPPNFFQTHLLHSAASCSLHWKIYTGWAKVGLVIHMESNSINSVFCILTTVKLLLSHPVC